jgi:tetratricopeptide (TPR) repeat protein
MAKTGKTGPPSVRTRDILHRLHSRSRSRSGAALAFALVGCAHGPIVERAYGGLVIDGRFIEPEAYAAFLRGAIAQASGDTNGALTAYEEAVRVDPSGPEIWTRLAEVRCSSNPRDARASEALTRALALDGRYARAWEAGAKCALRRGDPRTALSAARRATDLDPSADGATAVLARQLGASKSPTTRSALVVVTLTARDPLIAWDTLAAWTEERGDVALWARALQALVKIAPSRRDAVARAAENLAGVGEIGEARAVAAAAADADEEPLSEERHPLAARLAVDEAIARRDMGAMRRRATRVRLGADEVAARALLHGELDLARELATTIAAGDPSALGARLVLAAGQGGDLLGAAGEVRRAAQPVPGAVMVAFGSVLVHAVSPEQARATLASTAPGAIVPGDDRVVRAAVELVLRGALDEGVLPADGAIELAGSRAPSTNTGLATQGDRVLDARHEYLALALVHPEAPRVAELSERLAGVAALDPVVAAARALVQLGTRAPIDRAAPRALLASHPADPLVAATVLRLAEKTGDDDSAQRARVFLKIAAGGD